MLPLLAGMGVSQEKIIVLNPLDARAYGWDMAADITDALQADDVAEILIPKSNKGEMQPYFPDTARRFISAIIQVFQEYSTHWELRDIINATKTTERLRTILGSSDETVDLLENFEPHETYSSVKGTLQTNIRAYRSIASAWHYAFKQGRGFSISDWTNEQNILILGNSPRAKAPIRRLNQLILTQIGKTLLDKSGQSNSENWIFLDEVRELGYLENLYDLMTRGRSKSIAMVLGTQDVLGLDEVYGKNVSREIIGCAQNLAILHINSSQPDTQEWAARVLGDRQVKRTEHSESSSTNRQGLSTSSSASHRLHTEKTWLPSQFSADLPPTNDKIGMNGLYRIRNKFNPVHFPAEVLFGNKAIVNGVPQPDNDFSDIEPIDKKFLKLPDWTSDELKNRLKIPRLLEILENEHKSNTKNDEENDIREVYKLGNDINKARMH